MALIINTICLSLLILLEIILYFILTGKVLPRILRVRYSLTQSRGRGLKRYVYPDGRGISYEPCPAIRKYVDRYVLFTDKGYKYVQCRLDESVREIAYTVMMFNNRNKVIDVIDVKAKSVTGGALAPLPLHADTSYVELVLGSVNGETVEEQTITYYRVRDLLLYTLSMAAVSFAELWFAQRMLNVFFSWWKNGTPWGALSLTQLAVPALLIGVVCGALALLNARGKKIGWSK